MYIRAYTRTSKKSYGQAFLKKKDLLDQVILGFFSKDGRGVKSEMVVEWVNIGEKYVPMIKVYSDAWRCLSECVDLIEELGRHNGEDMSPDDFCKLLKSLYFEDMTNIKEES